MSYVAVPASRSRPFRSPWFLFHLCDLDAPAVAVAWQILFARSFGTPIRVPAILALGLSVWLIYATDRLLDILPGKRGFATARHKFHGVYRRKLFVALTAAAVLLAGVCSLLRPSVVKGGGLLGLGILLYMGAVHLLPRAVYRTIPKEINVGVLFAIGTCLAPACFGGLHTSFCVAASLFAALCCLNCCAIEIWEWNPLSATTPAPHVITQWCGRWLRPTLWILTAVAATLMFTLGPERLYAAVIVSALGFIAVASLQGRASTDLLRVLVDLPLLSPIVFLLLPMK